MTPDTSPEERSAVLLRRHTRRVVQELPGALAGNEEPVHQVRVAGRRLRVALRLLAPDTRPRQLRRAMRVLRRLTRVVGPARDLDVVVGLLEDRLAALDRPSLEQRTILGRLRSARARQRGQLPPAILDLDIAGLRRSLRRLQRRGTEPDAAQTRILTYRETQSAALLRDFSILGDRFLPDTLHALRRRVRRLRYAAEVEDAVRGDDSRAPLLWKRLQEMIGAIHDRVVLARRLDELAVTAEARGQARLARAARGEKRFAIGEARKLHAAFLALRPADLALRALEASVRRRLRPPRPAPGKRRDEGGVDAAPDHPSRDRGAARNPGDRR